MLKVKVKGATNLPDVDTFSGKSDPYATVSFQGKFLVGVTNASFVVGCLQMSDISSYCFSLDL